MDGERSLLDLTLSEVLSEIPKYEAKDSRIRNHISNLRNGVTVQVFPDGRACPRCSQGWREFQQHRKDLEQLSMDEAKAALSTNTRWLKGLHERETDLSARAKSTASSWAKSQLEDDDDDD